MKTIKHHTYTNGLAKIGVLFLISGAVTIMNQGTELIGVALLLASLLVNYLRLKELNKL